MQILGQKCTIRGIRECLHSELVDDVFGSRDSMSLGHAAMSYTLLGDASRARRVFGTCCE